MDVAVNQELMRDCFERPGESLDGVDAASVIIKELWNRLRESHRLIVVKRLKLIAITDSRQLIDF